MENYYWSIYDGKLVIVKYIRRFVLYIHTAAYCRLRCTKEKNARKWQIHAIAFQPTGRTMRENARSPEVRHVHRKYVISDEVCTCLPHSGVMPKVIQSC
jgi:hypothetical protein